MNLCIWDSSNSLWLSMRRTVEMACSKWLIALGRSPILEKLIPFCLRMLTIRLISSSFPVEHSSDNPSSAELASGRVRRALITSSKSGAAFSCVRYSPSEEIERVCSRVFCSCGSTKGVILLNKAIRRPTNFPSIITYLMNMNCN